MKKILQIAVGVSVCVATWVGVRWVRPVANATALTRPSEQTEAVKEGKTLPLEMLFNKYRQHQILSPQTHSLHTTSFFSSLSDSVEFNGRQALIKAQVSLFDRRHDSQFVWVVHIVTPSNKILFEKVYDDQVFILPPGETIQPTFSDQIDLPEVENAYINIKLIRFNGHVDLESLKDPEFVEMHTIIKTSKKIGL